MSGKGRVPSDAREAQAKQAGDEANGAEARCNRKEKNSRRVIFFASPNTHTDAHVSASA